MGMVSLTHWIIAPLEMSGGLQMGSRTVMVMVVETSVKIPMTMEMGFQILRMIVRFKQ